MIEALLLIQLFCDDRFRCTCDSTSKFNTAGSGVPVLLVRHAPSVSLCGPAERITFASRILHHALHNPLKTFKDAVHTRDFAVTAEIFLRPESDADPIQHQAEVLRDHVDAILLTDNQFGKSPASTTTKARGR